MAEKKQTLPPDHQEQSDKLREIEGEIVNAQERKKELLAQVASLKEERERLQQENAQLAADKATSEKQRSTHHKRVMPKLDKILQAVKKL